MGSQVRVVVDRGEIGKLLRGEGPYFGLRVSLERRGHAVAAQAGPGVEVHTFEGHDRVRVHVVAETVDAKVSEHRDRTLTRALDAAR